MRTDCFLDQFVHFTLCATFLLIVIAAAFRWVLHREALLPFWWLAAPAVGGVAACGATILRRITLPDVAAVVDRLSSGTRQQHHDQPGDDHRHRVRPAGQ